MATIRRGRIVNKAVVWGSTQTIQEQEIIHKPEPPEPPMATAHATIDSFTTPIQVGQPSRCVAKVLDGHPDEFRWQWMTGGTWHTGATNDAGDTDHSFNRPNGQWDNVFPVGPGHFPIRLQTLIDGKVVDQTGVARVIEVVAAPGPGPGPGPGPIPPPAGDVPRLHIDGVQFKTSAGLVWKHRGVSGFTAYQDWLAGNRQKLRDFFGWARSIGANTMRVFGEWGVTNFVVQQHANYYSELPNFLEWAEEESIRLQFCVFTSQGSGPPYVMAPSQRRDHMAKVNAALDDSVHLCEQNNEDWKNGDICHDLAEPAVALATRSAWEDKYDFYRQPGTLLDWTTEHTPRDDEWERKAKNMLDTARLGFPKNEQPGHEHPELPPTRKPAIGGEPMGIAEAPVAGRRTNDARACADYFAVAELLSAGANLHGDLSNLQSCALPGPNAQRCAEAVRDVWAAGIPADAAAFGQYTRGGLSDCPVGHTELTLRTYAMIQGNQATAVVVRPKSGWTPAGDHGWHIVKQGGPHGQILWLAR